MNVKITEATDHGNVYLLPKGNRIGNNSNIAKKVTTDGQAFDSLDCILDDVPDFGVCKSVQVPGISSVGIAEIKFLEDVFDFMVETYENSQERNLAGRTDFLLDPYIKCSVKGAAKDTLAEHRGSESIYDIVFDIVKCSIRVIYMSDDCSLLESKDRHDGIERKVLDYINQRKLICDKPLVLPMDECVECGI